MNPEIVKELDKILPVVVRVHGDHHPELREVGELYSQLKAAPGQDVIDRLKTVTQNFTVPEDACPTYAKAYKDLEALIQELA